MSYADKPLSRRDWLLLPGVSLLTVLAMAAIVEPICRVVWPVDQNDTCADATGNLPNCVVRMKNVEGPEYEYRFNECGYRSAASCGKKAAGTLRLVSMGTSISMGLWVPTEDLFANRAGAELATVLHRPVDVQNMGSLSVDMRGMPAKIPEAMGLDPDAIVIEVVPYDLTVLEGHGKAAARQPVTQRALTDVRLLIRRSRAGYMAQHMLLSDDAFLYQTYSNLGDADDVLRQPVSAACRRQYAAMGQLFANIHNNLKGADIPVFILPIPNRIAAGMMSDKIELANCDPRAFGREVSELARANGLLAVDPASYFAAVPHAERLYYAVDSHPGPDAHILLGHALAVGMADYFRTASAVARGRGAESGTP